MEKRKTPRIRFKGFSDDWEQRKLGDIVTRVVRKNENLESKLPLTISAQFGLIAQDEFFDKRIASKNISHYYLIRKGEFAYNKSTSMDAPWGAIKRLEHYDNGVLSTLYIMFRILDENKVNSDYIVSYYVTNLWHKGVREVAAEGARNHGLLNIAPVDFFETTLTIPSNENEQKNIGEYFRRLDRLITLHQRKLNILKSAPKFLLGIVWEQRKLGEVVGITSGFMGDSLLSDGKYHLTRIETIADGIVDENRVGYLNEKPDDMYLLKHGDILYSNINSISHMGKVAKYQGNSPLYHGINLLRLQLENNINSDFLLYLLNTEKCRNWAKTRANQAVSQASINQSLLTTQEIAISSFEEQKKIGDYFRNLDHLITLHQSKLEKLQKIKKALLERMFV